MVATRGRTFKRPWRRSCHSSKLKSSTVPIGRKDSWCFHAVGSSNAPLLGSTAAEGLPRIGRTSIATRWRSCGLPQSASCSENFVIPPDVFGQTLSATFPSPWLPGLSGLGLQDRFLHQTAVQAELVSKPENLGLLVLHSNLDPQHRALRGIERECVGRAPIAGGPCTGRNYPHHSAAGIDSGERHPLLDR